MRAGAAFLILCASSAFADGPVRGAGADLLQYPTGTILTAAVRRPLTARTEWDLRAGTDLAYHGGQGVRDDEHGRGWGGGAGLRWFPETPGRSLFAGVRLDLWRMRIDWKNHTDPALAPSGVSRFLIVQPMAEAGWDFWRTKLFVVGATVSAGWEINTVVRGASTGQGAIAAAGVALTFL